MKESSLMTGQPRGLGAGGLDGVTATGVLSHSHNCRLGSRQGAGTSVEPGLAWDDMMAFYVYILIGPPSCFIYVCMYK